jgi:DNA-binding transcriptional LysR family regulator
MKYFDPSIQTLRLVSETLRHGTLSRAAEHLHMSQSAASHSIKALESQIGGPLFLRERKGLRLSQMGQRILPHIEAALGNVDAAAAAFDAISTMKRGSLRIAGISSLLSTIVPALVRDYVREYPNIELSLFEGTDQEVAQWVLEGVAHVGFVTLPQGDLPHQVLGRDEWLAVIPTNLFGDIASIALKKLATHKFLMSGGGCEEQIEKLFTSKQLSISDSFVIRQFPTIQAMVAQGIGVSIAPSLVARPSEGCRVIPLKPREFRTFGMLTHPSGTTMPSLEAWSRLVGTDSRKWGFQKNAPKALRIVSRRAQLNKNLPGEKEANGGLCSVGKSQSNPPPYKPNH